MNRSRTMRIALLATTALVASLGVSTAIAETVVDNGDELDLSFFYGGGDYTDDKLTLIDGSVINGTFVASDLYDLRKGTIDAVLAGAAALEKSTTGTVTLLGTNTYTGGTQINGGTLIVSGGFALPDVGDVFVSSAALLQLNSNETIGQLLGQGAVALGANNLTVGGSGGSYSFGDISGSGKLIKSGAGSLQLIGTKSLTGGVEVYGGTLVIYSPDTTADGTIAMNGPSTLEYAPVAGTFNDSISLGSTGVNLKIDGNVATQAGVISDGGGGYGLTKTGTGTVILTANNTYAGLTTIAGGALFVGDGGTTGSIAGDIQNDAFLRFNRIDDFTFAGKLSGSGSADKFGNGTLTLTGQNDYTGSFVVWEGGLTVAPGATLGTGGIQAFGGSTINLGGTSQSVSGITLGNSFIENGSLSVSGAIIIGGGEISADLGGAGFLMWSVDPAADTILSGSNTYAGRLQIDDGIVRLRNGSAIDDGASVRVSTGATLFVENSETIDSLAGSGTANISPGQTLTVGAGGSGGIFGSVFSGTFAGSGEFVKVGSGIQTFDGANLLGLNSVTVNAGTLSLTNSNTIGGVDFNIAGGILDLAGVTDPTVTIDLLTGAGAIELGSTTLLTGGSNIDATLSGSIGGNGGQLKKVGTGTLTLSGNNSFDGGIEVAQGTLRLASNGAAGVGPITTTGSVIDYADLVDNAAPININSNSTQLQVLTGEAIQSGLISQTGGPRPLEKIGDGTLVLKGANTYTGLTTVTGGRLQLGDGGTLTGDIHVVDNGQAYFDFTQSGSYIYSGVLSGGQVSQSGTGTTTWTAANSHNYTGIGGGTLVLSGDGSLGVSNATLGLSGFGSTATLDLGGTTQSISLFTMFSGYSNAIINGTLNVSGFMYADQGLISADLAGSASLIKSGAGLTTLNGNNLYTGITNVNAGVLRILDAQALGTTTGGTVVASGAALEIGGAMIVGGEALTLNGSGIGNGGALRHLTGVVEYNGAITLGSASRINSDSLVGNLNIGGGIGGAGQDLTVGGVGNTQFLGNIATGTGSFTKDGTGSVQLFGTNSYTGVTTVNAGLLSLAGGSAIADSGEVVVNGGVLTVTTSERIGSLAGGAGTSVQLNAETLTSGGNNLSTVYDGVIFGSGNFDKEGSGTLTLSGANTLTGNMRLFDGGLTIAGAGTLGASTVGLFVQGTLDLGGTAQTVGSLGMSTGSIQNGSLTVNGNAFAQVGSISADLTVTGSLDKAFGSGDLTLSGNNTLSSVEIGEGTLIAANDAALTDNVSVNMSLIGFGVGPRLQINTNQTIGSVSGDLFSSIDLGSNILTTGGNNASTSVAGIVFGSGGLSKVGTGTFTLTGSNSYTGGTTVSGGTLQLSGSGRAGAIGSNISIADGAALDVTNTSQTVGTVTLTDNARVTSSFGIMGLFDFAQMNVGTAAGATAEISVPMQGGTINKSGAGKLLVSGALNGGFTGTVNLDAGTLQLYWQDALGTGNLNINGPSTLSLNNVLGLGNSQTFNNTITLAGAGATVDVNGNFSILNGAIGETSGSWGFSKTGSGMLHLGGVNTFSGGIDLVHGGIRLLNSNAAGTGPITTFGSVISYANLVNSAAPIIVNSNTTQLEVLAADVAQQSGVISEIGGPRPIEKIGTGTLTLSGANTYTGATTITAGTLNVTGGSALSNSAAVNIGAAGTLSLSASEAVGSLSGSGILGLSSGSVLTTGLDNSSSVYSGSSSGLGGLTKAGTGTMNLTGSNSFLGALTVAGGNLTVTPSGSLNGMSAFNVLGGASAFLGGSVQGVNGGGMAGTGLGALSVSSGGTMYLDDNTSLSGGTLSLASGSNLNLFLTTNTSQYPQISLSGSANIANANVGVYLDPISFGGTLATSFTYSNVISGSGVTGTFGSVNLLQSPSGLFSVAGIYTPTSAGIQVTRNSFSTLGGGGSNNGNVGDALEDIFTNGPSDPDIVNLITVIGSTPAGGIPAIYAAIAGAENSENTGAGLRTDDPWKQSVAERVNAARTTGCTVAGESWCLRRYAQASTSGGEVMSDVLGDPTAFDWLETGIRDAGSTSVWGRAIGAWGESQGDVNGPGSSQWTGGMIAGADRVFSSLLLAGVAMQYVETSVDFDSSENKSTVRSGQFGAYVSYGGAEAFVNGNLSLIGTQASANRYMSIGLLDYDIHSFARSWALTASVEGGTIMEIDGYRFEPTLAFNYQGAYPVDFKENGGGGLSLIVHPDDSNSLRSILSARVSRVFDIGDRNLVPQLRVDWRHEMLDRRQEFSAAFAGDPTVFFDVDGATYARDVFSAGASLTMPITGRVMGYVDAQGAFSEDSTSAMVSVGGRATW